jgi:hypothetical protein
MAQVFRPGGVLVIKLVLLGAVGVAAAAALLLSWGTAGPVVVGEAPGQPIPFSHKHHVGDDGIDCRYCHTSVEKASFAGIPSTDVCLSCHSQLFNRAPLLAPLRESARTGVPLRWTRVHKLPDFVYFDHGIHVAKGVACVECHGRVDEMPLTRRVATLEMQWCLACHRDPGPHLRPPGQVFDMTPTPRHTRDEERALMKAAHLLDERRRTDCSTCHR